MAEGGNIKIFVRMRPSRRPSGFFAVNPDVQQLEFNVPSNVDADLVNNTRTSYKFKFNGMFDMDATQDDVFDAVAREAVDSALDGFNSTIFAYGQTGSGKTFTITGGAERYQDRGIIPRALGRIFQAFKDRSNMQYSAYISYLELYNEAGYDLLDPSHETKTLEELPRVVLMEDEEGSVHLKNLSMHPASNEEEALNLLFLGDTNRAIAETPMNMASSRSHCIFTVSIEARQEGSSTVRRSKLHLVDLAGSERVHKTNATGQLFREASHINKSLHFLEMAIVALHEARKGKRTHIPYRNSMLTSVLRDSLGGNCKTTMIATINPEPEHTNESISTCHFAQRVALVRNAAIVNEETDPVLLVRQLRTKLQGMEQEMRYLKGEAGEEADLGDVEQESIMAACRAWVRGPGEEDLGLGKLSMTRIKAAFRALRSIALEGAGSSAGAAHAGAGSPAASGGAGKAGRGREDHDAAAGPRTGAEDGAALTASREDLKQLRAQLQMRDNEIAILVNMVKTAKATASAALPSSQASTGAGADAAAARSASALLPPTPGFMGPPSGYGFVGMPPHTLPQSPWTPGIGSPGASAGGAGGSFTGPASGTSRASSAHTSTGSSVAIMLANGTSVAPEVLKDREKALEAFRSAYPKSETIDSNKRVLKEKYDAAKALAERVNRAREETNRLKTEIERRRVERAMASIVEGKTGDEAADGGASAGAGADAVEEDLKLSMDAQKTEYKAAFQSLRDMKTEIEHIQRLLEGNRVKMQADFESWFANSVRRVEEAAAAGGAAAAGSSGAAGGASLNSTAASTLSGTAPGLQTTYGGSGSGGLNTSGVAGSSTGMSMAAGSPDLHITMSSGRSGSSIGGAPMPGYLMPGQVSLPALSPGLFPWGAGAPGTPGAAGGGALGAFPMMSPLGMTLPGMAGLPAFGMPGGMPPMAGMPPGFGPGGPMPPGMPPGMLMPPPGFAGSLPFGMPAFSGSGAPSSSASSVASGGRPGSGQTPSTPGSVGGSGGAGGGGAAPAIPLTGNAAADADILAFYKAKEELLRKRSAASSLSSAADALGGGGAFAMGAAGRPPSHFKPAGS